MAIITKFRCQSISEVDGALLVQMNAVVGNPGENDDYTSSTPNGQLQLTVENGTKAALNLETGRNYYLMIEDAPQ